MTAVPLDLVVLTVLVLVAAVLYSSGGHAGASAYLAIMALYSVAPAVMRPTALVMNIAVASIGSTRFIRARAIPWHLIGPLCAGSIPAAFAGGLIKLSPGSYLLLLGAVLLAAALFLWIRPRSPVMKKPPARAWLVGIGGGIFLSPLLILTGWEEPRRTSGAAAIFILVNSILGLLGRLSSVAVIPPQAIPLAIAAICGGLVGSWIGVNRLSPIVLRRIHSVVVLLSGVKLLYEGLRF